MEWRVDTRGREENHLNPLTRSIGVFGSVVGGGERRTMVSVGRHWHVSAIRPIIVATSWPTFQYANVRVRALHACLPPNSYPSHVSTSRLIIAIYNVDDSNQKKPTCTRAIQSFNPSTRLINIR